MLTKEYQELHPTILYMGVKHMVSRSDPIPARVVSGLEQLALTCFLGMCIWFSQIENSAKSV